MLTKSIKKFIQQFLIQTSFILNVYNIKFDKNSKQFPYLYNNGYEND